MFKRNSFARIVLFTSIAGIIAIIFVFFSLRLYYNNEKQTILNAANDQLKVIAGLKVNQLNKWYTDKYSDARFIVQNKSRMKVIADYLKSGDSTLLQEINLQLTNNKFQHDFSTILLATISGKIIYSTDYDSVALLPFIVDSIRNAIVNREIEVSNIYACAEHRMKHLDVIVPLLLPGIDSLAFIFRTNPQTDLYPIIDFWPTDRQSVETLLVTRSGDSVLFISNLLFSDNSQLQVKFPLSASLLPAARAVKGERGFFDGVDYRGQKVHAYLAKIPSTPWIIITKVDSSELYADLRTRVFLVSLIAAMVISLFALTMFLIFNYRQRKTYGALTKSKTEFRTTVYSIGDAVIITDNQGLITNMNPVAERLTGFTESEALGEPLSHVFKIVSEETLLEAEDPVSIVMREGKVVGLANHTMLISKQGEHTPIADSGAPIRDESGFISGVVLVFRDQSAERTFQNELEASEKKYRNIFENSPQPMWIYDEASLKFLEVNRSAIMHYGYSRAEFLEKRITDLILPMEIASGETMQMPLLPDEGIWRHMTKRGETIFVEVNSNEIIYNNAPAHLMLVNDVTSRHKADELLRESESRLQSVLENMLEGCQIIGFDWNLIYLNRTADSLINIPREQLIGKSFINLYPGFKETETYIALKHCLEERIPSRIETQLEFPDGSLRWFNLSIQPVPEGAFILSIDITERKKMLETLSQSERKFRTLFENHTAVKLLIDPETGNIIDANGAASAFYGWSVDELKRMSIFDINTLSPSQIRNEFKKVSNSLNTPFYFIHRLKDGTLCNVEVFSSRVQLDGKELLHSIVHDITERKKAEQRVNLMIRSLERTPVGIVITDADGNAEYGNPKYFEITGFKLDDILGIKPDILHMQSTNPELDAQIWKTISAGKEWKGEFEHPHSDVIKFWAYGAISPVFDFAGKLTNYVIVIEDITEERQLLTDLMDAKTKAQENDRLKTAFLANMSHEIRTPMNGILGFMNLLHDPELTSEVRDEYIKIVQASGNRLLNTINDIIDVSKIESGQVQITSSQTDLDELFKSLHQFFSAEATAQGVLLTIDAMPETGKRSVITDKTKIESVLTNLIKNALKFTSQGSIRMGCRQKGDWLQFFVSDTGTGIPKDKVDKVFERFVQAETGNTRNYEGSGLGLSISQSYISLLGGRIWVESTLGKGSDFYFEIPYQPAIVPDSKQPLLNNGQNKLPLFSSCTVLIAEDDEISFKLIDKLLTSRGIKTLRARNGVDAVKLVHDNPEIALVFMDIKMPVMDGFMATRSILRHHPGLPVVALTAYAFPDDKDKALEAGCANYLSKPLRKEFLYDILSSYLQMA